MRMIHALLWAIAIGLLPAPVLAQGGCYVKCEESVTGGCVIAESEQLEAGAVTFVQSCADLSLSRGVVTVHFKEKDRYGTARLTADRAGKRPLKKIRFQCLWPEQSCAGSLDAEHIPGGKQYEDASIAVPVGEPCSKMLPCGNILPNEDGSLQFPVRGLPPRSRLTLKPVRGTRAETTVQVVQNNVALRRGTLQPGATYNYKVSSGGKTVAVGAFTVLSEQSQKDAREGLATADDLGKELWSYGLYWNAVQPVAARRKETS